MTESDRSQLGELYAKPQSYEEREAARLARVALRRPRMPALHMALSSCLGFISIVGAIYCMEAVMGSGLSSIGQALTGVSAFMMAGLIAVAVLVYAFASIDRLLRVTIVAVAGVKLLLFFVVSGFAVGARVVAGYPDINTSMYLGALIATFIITYGISQLSITLQSRSV